MLTGILADDQAEFRTSLPINLEVVPTDNKIAKAQFRAPAGAEPFAVGPGTDRGGAEWRGQHHRVMGGSLVRIDSNGSVTVIGAITGNDPVRFTEGFGRLAIRGGRRLYYLTDSGLTEVTDPELGPCVDVIWIDGYTMSTDGEHVVVTELTNPLEVKPLKYGSAEDDPDPITGLVKTAGEAFVLGRYSIQVLQNVGGAGFPFQTVPSATMSVGCVGPDAKCEFAGGIAMVGGARGEAIGVYLAGAGEPTRISDRRIDDELAKVADPSQIVLENRTSRAERRLLIHLPDKTLVYFLNASRLLQEDVWAVFHSGQRQPYRLRYATLVGNRTFVGDLASNAVGLLSDQVSTHFGEPAEWQFDAGLIYNEGRGGILHTLELVGLPGRAPFGEDPRVYLSWSRDGQTFGIEREASMGKAGEHAKRIHWRPRLHFRNYLALRLRGFGAAMPGFASLEAGLSGLAV